jgi:hypothetical protein
METIGTTQTDPQKGYPEEYFREEKHLLARFLLQKLQKDNYQALRAKYLHRYHH